MRPALIGSAVRVAIGEGDTVGDCDSDSDAHALAEGDRRLESDATPDNDTVTDCDGERETESVTLGEGDAVKLDWIERDERPDGVLHGEAPAEGELSSETVCKNEYLVIVAVSEDEGAGEVEGLADSLGVSVDARVPTRDRDGREDTDGESAVQGASVTHATRSKVSRLIGKKTNKKKGKKEPVVEAKKREERTKFDNQFDVKCEWPGP